MGADPKHEASKRRPGSGPAPPLGESGRRLVYLAAERTVLTWIRAAIGLMLLGFAIDRFGILLAPREEPVPHGVPWSTWLGLSLIASGVLTSAVSAFRYGQFAHRYDRGDARPGPGIPLAIALCVLLALAGSVLVALLWLKTTGAR